MRGAALEDLSHHQMEGGNGCLKKTQNSMPKTLNLFQRSERKSGKAIWGQEPGYLGSNPGSLAFWLYELEQASSPLVASLSHPYGVAERLRARDCEVPQTAPCSQEDFNKCEPSVNPRLRI